MVHSEVRVRYSETDGMGIAYHANHLVWFEVGRSDYCRAAGVPYSEMEKAGFFLVVTEVACRYVKPAVYDQQLVVQTQLKEINRRTAGFEYLLLTEHKKETLASGHTRHIVLDRAGRPASLPAEWVDALKRLQP